MRNFLRVVLHTLKKLNISEYEDGLGFIRSLNMMCSLYLLLTKYSWAKMTYDHGTLSTTTGFEENLDGLADACLLKVLAERILEKHEVSRAYEAKSVLLEHASSCLRHAYAANSALTFALPGLEHIDDFEFEPHDIVELKGDILLFNGISGENSLTFVNMLGGSKSYGAGYVQPRRIYRFQNSLTQ